MSLQYIELTLKSHTPPLQVQFSGSKLLTAE